jgi:hypothetical protein
MSRPAKELPASPAARELRDLNVSGVSGDTAYHPTPQATVKHHWLFIRL